MSVRLMFRCVEKGEVGYDTAYSTAKVRFQAQYADTPEAKAFYASTPTGSLEFGTVNKEAAAQLEIGKDYYITIEAAAAGR